MKREKHAEWWATPPKLIGPLVVILVFLVVSLCGFFVAGGKFQEAILTCAAGAVFILVALLDLVAELIRYQRLILDGLENQKRIQD
jgi:4-amino-4-deoxy-L-arabinose transferase-like glycosyltransferase